MLKLEMRRVAKKLTGDDVKYRGMVAGRGVVDYESVLKEVAERRKVRIPEMRYHLETFFDCVREMMLEDGCSRRIGDYLLLQLNVRGSFASADDEIDTERQELRITARSMGQFCHLERDKNVEISNVNPRTRGKAESVMSEGGDAGTLVYGKNILLVGHGFEWDKGQLVLFNCKGPDGKKLQIACDIYLFKRNYDPVEKRGMQEYNALEADDTHVLMKWPKAVSRHVIGQKVSVAYIDYHNAPTAQVAGSHAYATVVAD